MKGQTGVACSMYFATQFGLSAAVPGILFSVFDRSNLDVVVVASFGCLGIPSMLRQFSSMVNTRQ